MNERIEIFRAPDAAAVLTTLGGGSALSAYDALTAPVDVLDLLEQLIAPDPDAPLTTGLVWPEIDLAAWGCFVSAAPNYTEDPWTWEFTPAVRDALTAADPDELAALRPYDPAIPAIEPELLGALAELAHRATAAGQSLYYRPTG
ncbi:hypothetical protein [Kitasatospora sp. CB01950]|uniref:hypothetical protein n=1 Tax=Kitasatospora sp. CB01950 TaxID=1703930 RepID=UPI00093F499C|nr:hypothetical protein [Kitasatospora sp. CB01950]OKJ16061.1 hypothetical protein AMK19_07820 [Kitasatospora sp. CB01950]